MPLNRRGAAIPSVHDENISREIVNNVNVDVVEDALRRLEIAFPPASTSTEENFEAEREQQRDVVQNAPDTLSSRRI